MMLATPAATEAAGAALARAILAASSSRLSIWLSGELGAGKTTFCRGFLRALGHTGRVPSPTYTLVEPYNFSDFQVYHLDLYRLRDGAELEYLGLEELWDEGAVLLVEWPAHGGEMLPPADVEISLQLSGPDGISRDLIIDGVTDAGAGLLRQMENARSD